MKTERWIILREQPSPRITLRSRSRGISQISLEAEDLSRQEQGELSRDPNILSHGPALPMRLISPFEEAPQSESETTWGIKAIQASQCRWTGSGVTVAILDTGIQIEHPAFKGMKGRIQEFDFTGEGLGDLNGHGTHCAGTVFGNDNQGLRYSVAPGIKRALIGKVLGKHGGGSTESVCNGIHWALTQGANVISMSLGFDFPGYVAILHANGMPLELATSRALEGYLLNVSVFDTLSNHVLKRSEEAGLGTIIIAAAGNESRRDQDPDFVVSVAPPAVSDHVIAVGAMSKSGSIAPFSNGGPDLVAPGVGISSVDRSGGLSCLSGTSMAAPHVAGAAALWAESLRRGDRFPTSKVLAARLLGQARPLPGVSAQDQGAGLVNSPLS